jgi:hypothetical protein
METVVLTHHHPKDYSKTVIGKRLESGDILEDGDVYDSTSGNWERQPILTGTRLRSGFAAYWVRPDKRVSFRGV